MYFFPASSVGVQAAAAADGEAEHEAVPAELLHHEGERAAAQGGQAAQPGEPGPALRAQATPRQVGRRQQQCAGGEPRVQGRP
jgi:hypothetical protein